jgi:hypothetical protein
MDLQTQDNKKHDQALQFLLKTNVINECPRHSGAYYRLVNNASSAYELANHQYSHGEHTDLYSSRREMTDVIKAVFDEIVSDRCHACYDDNH